MNIDGTAVLAFVSLGVTAVGTVLFALSRFSVSFVLETHKKEIAQLTKDRDEQRKECREIADRVRVAELAETELRGIVAGQKQQIDALEREHVPRAEWEAKVDAIVDRLDDIARRLDRSPGRYSSSDPAMPAQGRRNPT